MKEYFCIYGSSHYFINMDYGEACSFNSFGEKVENLDAGLAYATVGQGVLEVDIVSILGESGKDYCEVYFKGKTAMVNKNYLEVYSSVNSLLGKVSFLAYRIEHGEGVMQLLVPFRKGKLDREKLLPGIEWVSI